MTQALIILRISFSPIALEILEKTFILIRQYKDKFLVGEQYYPLSPTEVIPGVIFGRNVTPFSIYGDGRLLKNSKT